MNKTELIRMLDSKLWKHLKIFATTKAKLFFHLLILWLPLVLFLNTYSLLYQTATLDNILFFAVVTNNDINKVPALAIEIVF